MIVGLRKPAGMTSHDLVEAVRSITGERRTPASPKRGSGTRGRVGHGGTLDPFAEGVLVVGVGRESTKKLNEILKNTEKEYEATLELGKTSTTGDPEGEIKSIASAEDVAAITKENIEKALAKFVGNIKQKPPVYSAIKIHGTPAYKRARRGETPDLPQRTVEIKSIELLSFEPPYLTIRTVVGSGTYIRSLAEDVGASLGVGAYLTKLVRTRVGEFTLEASITPDELKSRVKGEYNR